jgi:hypothetical protein
LLIHASIIAEGLTITVENDKKKIVSWVEGCGEEVKKRLFSRAETQRKTSPSSPTLPGETVFFYDMKHAILYFTGRATDIFTTWLNVRLGGHSVEASPVGRWSMEAFGFTGYIIMNLAISSLAFLMIKYLKRPWLMTASLVAFYGISVWNLAIYMFISTI